MYKFGLFIILLLTPSVYSDLDWADKKRVIDLTLELQAGIAKVNERNILNYGEPCSPEEEKQRTSLSLQLITSALKVEQNSDISAGIAEVKGLINALINLKSNFCNGTHLLQCTERGMCECFVIPERNIYLTFEDGYCRLQAGSPCAVLDIFARGRLEATGPINANTEISKCAENKQCLIKDNGKRCTKRNVGKEFKKAVEDSYGLSPALRTGIQGNLTIKVGAVDYCICGGNLDRVRVGLVLVTTVYSIFYSIWNH